MNRSGFTLLEVLVTAVLMGAAFAVLAQGFLAASRNATVSRARTAAAGVAAATMARIEAGGLPLTTSTSTTVEEEGRSFEVVVTPEATDHQGLKRVRVEVTWSLYGREFRTELARYIHEALRKEE